MSVEPGGCGGNRVRVPIIAVADRPRSASACRSCRQCGTAKPAEHRGRGSPPPRARRPRRRPARSSSDRPPRKRRRCRRSARCPLTVAPSITLSMFDIRRRNIVDDVDRDRAGRGAAVGVRHHIAEALTPRSCLTPSSASGVGVERAGQRVDVAPVRVDLDGAEGAGRRRVADPLQRIGQRRRTRLRR